MRLGLKDDLLDAQALRALGAAPYGGADIGECLKAAREVEGTDLDSWYESWAALAARTLALAESELSAGRTESARLAYLRSSTYDRTAGVMLMASPVDPRLVASVRRQTAAFRAAAALMTQPPEVVEIPYEGVSLPGYFFRVDDDPRPRRTAVLVNGYDGTAEELYFMNAAAALSRGYNVLAFDGPGQGAALLERGLVMRPDWEAVLTPVLDFVLAKPDVDPDRVVLIGLSLGGYLAPRAVTGEHRFAACIADCGSFDLYQSALARVPGPLVAGLDDGGLRGRALEAVLSMVSGRSTSGWGLRRGMFVHGVDHPAEYLELLRDYTLAGRTDTITTPTLVCHAEGDDISASAPDLHAALRGNKQLIKFTAAEGADNHCEVGARLLYHARTFGWLESVLAAKD